MAKKPSKKTKYTSYKNSGKAEKRQLERLQKHLEKFPFDSQALKQAEKLGAKLPRMIHEHCTHTPEQHYLDNYTCKLFLFGGPCCHRTFKDPTRKNAFGKTGLEVAEELRKAEMKKLSKNHKVFANLVI